jgi:hypothetical protein
MVCVFLNVGSNPNLCIKMVHTTCLIKIIQQSLTRKLQRSNQSRLTDRCRNTYNLNEGGGHVRAHARTSHLRTSSNDWRSHQNS